MKIPIWILTVVAGAFLTLQGWTLNEVVNLNADVAAIKAVLKPTTIASNEH